MPDLEGLLVEINSQEFLVEFWHSPDPGQERRFTACRIFLDGELISEAHSVVHPNDNYNNVIGRCATLERAIANASMYNYSNEFWNAYSEQFGIDEIEYWLSVRDTILQGE